VGHERVLRGVDVDVHDLQAQLSGLVAEALSEQLISGEQVIEERMVAKAACRRSIRSCATGTGCGSSTPNST
jgi:hypothetical protein